MTSSIEYNLMSEQVRDELSKLYNLHTIEVAKTGPNGLIHHGDLVMSAFEHMYVARKNARTMVRTLGLLPTLGPNEDAQDERLEHVLADMEHYALQQLGQAIAGVHFVARSHPDCMAIYDQPGQFLPYATGMVPPDDPDYFCSTRSSRSFHLQAAETGERLTMVPLNSRGMQMISLWDYAS